MTIRKTALLVAALVLVGFCDPWAVARGGSEKARSGLYSSTKSLGSISLTNRQDETRDARGSEFRLQADQDRVNAELRTDLPFSDPAQATPISREDFHAVLNEANAAFQQANAAQDPDAGRQLFDKAILLYEKIIDQGGIRNAGLYYNLANAYLLKDDLGRAILNYRRAERLDRSDLNIKKNLAFARSRRIDRVETAAPKRVLETLFFWHYDLSLRTRFLLVCLAFAALCLAGIAMIRRGRGTASTAGAVLSGVLVLSLLASILIETHRQSRERFGVVTTAEVVARQGDGPNYPPSFKDPLHEGTEFDLIEQRPGWLHIRLADGADAWVPEDAAELGGSES